MPGAWSAKATSKAFNRGFPLGKSHVKTELKDKQEIDFEGKIPRQYVKIEIKGAV